MRHATRNMSASQKSAFVSHLQEQEDVLNWTSRYHPDDLEYNLAMYKTLDDAGLIDRTRQLGARQFGLQGTGQHAAHGLDAVAGGYPYFIIGGRDSVQSTIGSLWRNRVQFIRPGARHRLVPAFTE